MSNTEAAGVIVVGCGHVGTRIALREQALGGAVIATFHRDGREHELRDHGLDALRLDLDAGSEQRSPRWHGSTVYYLVPPGSTEPEDARAQRLVETIGAERPRVLVMISTTGIYGDCGGAWVNEDTAPRPGTDRARRRLVAEKVLVAWAQTVRVPLAVMRVAGIYGPGRLPIERLRRAEPVLDPAESGYTNRIHVDDLVRTCMAAARRCDSQRVYNVADGNPGSMSDYFLQLADLLGIARPPIISRAEAGRRMTSAMLSYLDESRRIDNTRLRTELGVELDFVDLDAGLRQAIALSDLGDPADEDVRLLVCVNQRLTASTPSCGARGSAALADRLQQEIDLRGLDLSVQRLHCLGRCEQGPNVRIAPGGEMFHRVADSDRQRILESAVALAQRRRS